MRYAAFFWNPTGTAQQSGLVYPDALSGIVRAILDARADFGITGRMMAAIDREASAAAAAEMVKWALENRCDEVVGIGIDYREEDHPPEWFAPGYALARRGGLKTTAHAGEFGLPWTNVRTAVEILQADRIDNGYSILDNPACARECAERGIVFTVTPTISHFLLPALFAARALGRRSPDSPHARRRPAHPSEHRQPDAAPRQPDAGLGHDGVSLWFCCN